MDDPPRWSVARPASATLAVLVALSSALLGHACTRTDVVTVQGGSVVVAPGTWTAVVGETTTFSAEARDDQGRPVPGAEVMWSSSEPSLLSVSPDGRAEAEAPGAAEVRATALGVTGTAAVTVEPGPSIVARPEAVSFFVDAGADPPAAVSVAVTNGGSGLLSGLAATVDYGTGPSTGWLTPGLSSTDAPATLTVEGRTASLSPGQYEARLLLTSPVARNSPVEVPVELSVTEDVPILHVLPGAVGFAAVAGGPPPPPKTVEILNGGAGTLDGLSVDVAWVEGPPGWLTASLSNEATPADLTLTPDAGTLGSGSWRADVTISAPGAVNSPRTLPVTFTVEPEPVADLSVLKTGPTQVVEGDTVEFLLALTNEGPRDAADVRLVDSLPEGLDFVSAAGEATGSSDEVVWSLGTVVAGETVERTVRAVAAGAGQRVNVARALSSTRDTVEANDRDPLTVEVTPLPSDLAVQKLGPATAALGGTVVYVLTTSNAGPGPAADVVVVDSLPAGVTVLSSSAGGIRSGRAVTWDAGTVPAGASRIDSVVVRVDASGELTDVARVSTTSPEGGLSDNRSVVTTVVEPEADLSVEKTGPESVGLLETIVYEITVSNDGPDEARNVEVVDSLPGNATYVSSTGGGVRDGGTVTWTFEAVGPGETVTDTLRVQPQFIGTVTNVVRASSTTADPDPTDLRSVVETTVGVVEAGAGLAGRPRASPPHHDPPVLDDHVHVGQIADLRQGIAIHRVSLAAPLDRQGRVHGHAGLGHLLDEGADLGSLRVDPPPVGLHAGDGVDAAGPRKRPLDGPRSWTYG